MPLARLHILLAALLLAAAAPKAEIPAGYYAALDGKSDADLKEACHLTVRSLSRVSSYSALPQYFKYTDVYPNSDRWWDMYSDIVLYAPSFSGLNREHSFPKSWWGGDENVNAYVDLFHLYPSEMQANQAKSNYPLGTVDRSSAVKFDNGVSTVGYPVIGQGGGCAYVYEPDDEYKGDFARTYFYMVTCYQDLTWNTRYMYMLQQNSYPTLKSWAIDMLLKWSREDPVSQKELDRNEVVYGFQNNRNPFIDFPMLAEHIWGDRRDEPFYLADYGAGDNPSGEPSLISPAQGMCLDLGQVAIGARTSSRLLFHGESLSEALSLSVYSGDSQMFSIPSECIEAYLVNSAEGYWLNVTYEPTSLGQHQTKLLISDGGLPEARIVSLVGECLPRPELHRCVAQPASDITSTSYVANWTAPEEDEIDFFVVTRTIYAGAEASEQQLVADDTSLLIEDFDLADKESYYVQSSRLGFLSDPSNVVFVDHSGITGVAMEEPLALIGLPGAVRFVCSAPHSDVRIYDATGRLIVALDEVTHNTDISLPTGFYIVTTREARTPRRVTVK